MFGPLPIPAPVVSQDVSPTTNPAPLNTETVDSPRQSVANRQPLELPSDKVDLSSEVRGHEPKPDEVLSSPREFEAPDFSDSPNAGVTFKILNRV